MLGIEVLDLGLPLDNKGVISSEMANLPNISLFWISVQNTKQSIDTLKIET